MRKSDHAVGRAVGIFGASGGSGAVVHRAVDVDGQVAGGIVLGDGDEGVVQTVVGTVADDA